MGHIPLNLFLGVMTKKGSNWQLVFGSIRASGPLPCGTLHGNRRYGIAEVSRQLALNSIFITSAASHGK